MQVTSHRNKMSLEQVYRRAGGRRRYNAQRAREAAKRRVLVESYFLRVAEEFLALGRNPRGWQTRLARQLGISRMQVSRDFDTVLAEDSNLRSIARWLEAAVIVKHLHFSLSRVEHRMWSKGN